MKIAKLHVGLFGQPASRALGLLALSLLVPLLAVAQQQSDEDIEPFDDYEELQTRGEYTQALKALQLRIKASSNFVRPSRRRHLAELQFMTGDVRGAIETMTTLTQKNADAYHFLRLALMYEYIGERDQYMRHLSNATREANRPYGWDYSRRDANVVARNRIAELLGENPKSILNTRYGVVIDRYNNKPLYHTGAGELAYRYAAYDIAAEHFLKALEMDETSQDAMAGLAECYWKSNDPRLGPMIERLTNINPNHPRAKAIEIEKLLDSGNGRAALHVIEEMLETNPVSTRFRSLKAAALFLEDEIEDMEELQAEVTSFNKYSSEPYRTAGRIASRHYLFKEGAALQKQALEVNPDDHEARALYTLDLLRMGEEEVGRVELERAFQDDPYNVHMFNLLELMDTVATFESVESDGFILRLPKHEADLVADDSINLLEEAMARYEKKYDVDIEKPVLVEMFDNHDDFMVRSVGLPGSAGHLGICFGKLVTLDSPSARPRGSWNWRSVLWHEFVHVITLQKTNNRMPRWLSEGISVHEERQYSEAWTSRLDPNHRPLLDEEGVPGVRDLDAFFTQAKSAGHLMFGYFAAGVFVDFYMETYGIDAMNAALTAIGEGDECEESLAESADVSFREMDKDFIAFFEKRIEPFDNLPASTTEEPGMLDRMVNLFKGAGDKDDSIEPPSSVFTDALGSAAEAMEDRDWGAAEEAFKEAHELFPDHTGADAPLRQLAALYARTGQREKLVEALEQIVFWTPAELDASKQLLELYEDNSEWEDVVRIADWVVGIDPYDVELQLSLAQGLAELSERERALDVLGVLTHLDRAHAMDHRLKRAELFAEGGELEPARHEIVRVLEEAPHYLKAQELLLSIIDQKEKAPEAPDAPEAKLR